MIAGEKINKFSDVLHRNATDKQQREWTIFRPYPYRGTINRVLKVAEATSHNYTIKWINGSLQKTTKREVRQTRKKK